ncbi:MULTISPECIES: arginase family protein [unclassified Bradyrhizobium]|uniref:arginase family protein n=1 Tax=unclassified Bradyrhizobium TaxID=2631580 RepID=UPI0020B3C53E|nr:MULTISPECIES: arginase family protein [unclassified Bradyrhizobium]MCP3398925.1 arginase family protein [Bradyrhizobium sp. CCGB20]MCP3407526.1 arginase family protein [Bradyrhizobium sp. CCGB01]
MTHPVTPATLLGLPAATTDTLSGADVVIFGVPDATLHVPGSTSHAARAPSALRESTEQIARDPLRWDFDQDGPLIPGGLRAIDLGDLPTNPATPQENRSLITSTTASILKADAVPMLIGGDDSVPIPFFAGFEQFGPLTILQIDAHLDWRDERAGLKHTFSRTMRRASEMPWVERIIQVGQRGIGGSRAEDLAAARAWGVKLFSAASVRGHGVQAVLDHIPPGSRCIVTLDCDGLDPAVIPAVLVPQPGGLGYFDVVELLHGVTQRARIVGLDLVELVPDADVRGLGVLAAARILCVALGCIARQRSTAKSEMNGAPMP